MLHTLSKLHIPHFLLVSVLLGTGRRLPGVSLRGRTHVAIRSGEGNRNRTSARRVGDGVSPDLSVHLWPLGSVRDRRCFAIYVNWEKKQCSARIRREHAFLASVLQFLQGMLYADRTLLISVLKFYNFILESLSNQMSVCNLEHTNSTKII